MSLQRELEIQDLIANAMDAKLQAKDTVVKKDVVAVPAAKKIEHNTAAAEKQNDTVAKAPEPAYLRPDTLKNDLVITAHEQLDLPATEATAKPGKDQPTAPTQTGKTLGSTPAPTPTKKNDDEQVASTESIKPLTSQADTALRHSSGKNVKPRTLNDRYTRTAEVNVDGIWQKATIVDKESEYLYKVHYAGKGEKDDEWVAVSQIRNMDSVKNEMTTTKTRAITPTKVVNCTFTAPSGPVSDADQFSLRLAKRKLYENYVKDVTATDVNGKVGLTFLSFTSQRPFVNTVSVSNGQSLVFKYSAAPAGAMIYPFTTKFKLCEETAGTITSNFVEGTYACFRNKEGIWSCLEK